jgi:hypothetical protein
MQTAPFIVRVYSTPNFSNAIGMEQNAVTSVTVLNCFDYPNFWLRKLRKNIFLLLKIYCLNLYINFRSKIPSTKNQFACLRRLHGFPDAKCGTQQMAYHIRVFNHNVPVVKSCRLLNSYNGGMHNKFSPKPFIWRDYDVPVVHAKCLICPCSWIR